MKHKMKRCTILQTLIVIIGFYCTAGDVNLEVIDGLLEERVFECNNHITFRCRLGLGSYIVQWYVGRTIGTFSDANCVVGTNCSKSSAFPGRYHYTYDQNADVSYLNIVNVSFDDDQMMYQCSDGSSKDVYDTVIVKAPPKFDTTFITVTTTTNYLTATLTTGCIYPHKELTVVWFSTLVNDSDALIHPGINTTKSCTPVQACISAVTSFVSDLHIYTSTDGQERVYSANISFGSVQFTKVVGQYKVTLDTTTIPTTSASSLPSSSIAIFTTSSSTGTGKEQNQNTDKTSTILIIAFSSLCGIALLLIVVFAINKIRKRYKKQSGASNDHEM